MDKKYSDLPFRTVDFMNAFEFAIDQSIKVSPDLIVITGDTYDTYDPSNAARTFLNVQLKKLSDVSLIIILLMAISPPCNLCFR